MTSSSIEQYENILSDIPRPSISSDGEKYVRFKNAAQILQEIFTPDVWNEWDAHFLVLRECYQKGINPQELDENFKLIHEWKYPHWFPTPRLFARETLYLMMALQSFGIEKIEDYISNKPELSKLFTYKDLVKFSGWWANACETGRHIFQNFKFFLWRWNHEPTNLDPWKIKWLMQSSSMLDTETFNRFSIRNFAPNVHWILEHIPIGDFELPYTPWERVGCPFVRKFRWLPTLTNLFDKLFDRICTIYGYNPTSSAQISDEKRPTSGLRSECDSR